jgi:hypothetical protein
MLRNYPQEPLAGFRDEKFLEPGALVRARRGGAASDPAYIVGLVFESL